MAARHLLLLILLTVSSSRDDIFMAWAQQSAAGQDTLIGIVGRDFIMMGADSSSSGGIALTSSDVDKIAVLHDGMGVLDDNGMCHDSRRQSLEQQAIAIGFAGDAADADRLVGMLKTHAQVREYEAGLGDVLCVFDGQIHSSTSTSMLGAMSPAGLDAEAIAHLSRSEISSRMRSQQPLQLCLLVGGMGRCNNPMRTSPEIKVVDRVRKQITAGSATFISKGNSAENDSTFNTLELPNSRKSALNGDDQKSINQFLTPKLFWLDQYGSLLNMRYAVHGYGSSFAYSVLDQRYRSNMSQKEAADLIRECFAQLSQRYVINSPQPPRIKCIDMFGVTEISENGMEH